jgi:hypothetical protein
MTKLPPNHPFRKHSQNAAAVKKGLLQIERLHKAALRANDGAAVDVLGKMHALAIGMMAEARLRQVIADPGGFNDAERMLLGGERSQLERWKRSVELAFRRHYLIPIHLPLDTVRLGPAVASQHDQVMDLLDGRLSSVIDDRNKTAHAQWLWHLNSKETSFVSPAPATPNYRSLLARSKIISGIAELVHILVVSEPTFQRDYFAVYSSIVGLEPLLDGHDQADYVRSLRATRAQMCGGVPST